MPTTQSSLSASREGMRESLHKIVWFSFLLVIPWNHDCFLKVYPFLFHLHSSSYPSLLAATLYTHLYEVLLHFRPEQSFSFYQPSSPDEVHHAVLTQAAVIL